LNSHRFGRLGAHEDDFNSNASDSIEIASCMAASIIAKKHKDVKLVCCITHSGRTAVDISQFRVGVPIIALSDQVSTVNRLCLAWGITPILIDDLKGSHAEGLCVKHLVNGGLAKPGDLVVLVLGAETLDHMAHTVRLLRLPEHTD